MDANVTFDSRASSAENKSFQTLLTDRDVEADAEGRPGLVRKG